MLNTHQILGFSTLGLMAATAVVGQLNYNDIYTHGGGHSGDFIVPEARDGVRDRGGVHRHSHVLDLRARAL